MEAISNVNEERSACRSIAWLDHSQNKRYGCCLRLSYSLSCCRARARALATLLISAYGMGLLSGNFKLPFSPRYRSDSVESPASSLTGGSMPTCFLNPAKYINGLSSLNAGI